MHRYTPLVVPVPAGTTAAAPVQVTWSLYPGRVAYFRVRIPAGHSGLTGVRITYKGTPVIPFDLGQYLVGDSEAHQVTWDDEIMATGLAVQAFNTDIYPHTFYLWADVDPYIPGVQPRVQAVTDVAQTAALAQVAGLRSPPRPRRIGL